MAEMAADRVIGPPVELFQSRRHSRNLEDIFIGLSRGSIIISLHHASAQVLRGIFGSLCPMPIENTNSGPLPPIEGLQFEERVPILHHRIASRSSDRHAEWRLASIIFVSKHTVETFLLGKQPSWF